MQRLLTPLRLLLALLLASLATLGGCIEPPYTNIDNARLQELQSQGEGTVGSIIQVYLQRPIVPNKCAKDSQGLSAAASK